MKRPGGYSNSYDPRSVKPSFRQIAFRRRVVDGRVSVEERVLSLGPGHCDCLSGCRGSNSAPLEGGDHRPPDLVNLLAAPGSLPIADPADALAGTFVDDLELP